jgi:hypothetical protein
LDFEYGLRFVRDTLYPLSLDPIEDHLLEPPYKILKPTGLVGALGLVKSKGAGRLHSQALHADTIRE